MTVLLIVLIQKIKYSIGSLKQSTIVPRDRQICINSDPQQHDRGPKASSLSLSLSCRLNLTSPCLWLWTRILSFSIFPFFFLFLFKRSRFYLCRKRKKKKNCERTRGRGKNPHPMLIPSTHRYFMHLGCHVIDISK